jgi:hypothetical protein
MWWWPFSNSPSANSRLPAVCGKIVAMSAGRRRTEEKRWCELRAAKSRGEGEGKQKSERIPPRPA